jgi:3-hydroxypropionyl-CoA synthetase (ADP-forming)
MTDNLTDETMERIDVLLQKAYEQGRDCLFEHEVYQILNLLNLNVPRHLLVIDPDQIDEQMLDQFGSSTVVLKVVSRDIAHKQKAGGVRVVYKDAPFVRFNCAQMRDHFSRSQARFEGILLVEKISYTHELGNEILLGFRESETFGPVLSFSKGGADAEHFAAHFSPPNLILAPIDRQWSQALLQSTHIHQKYLQEGRAKAVEMIVDAGVKFSALSLGFSNYFEGHSDFAFREFEVNPFVFNSQGRFIALDGFARFEKRSRPMDVYVPVCTDSMRPFFEPQGIAVVGVSVSDPQKVGNIILSNLIKLQRGDVYAVNPKGGALEQDGRTITLARRVQDIPASVDLAVIAVPADAALPAVQDCSDKGVKAVILIPGGFSEIDRNRDAEKRILGLAHEMGFRVMGPNCLGIIYAGSGLGKRINTFFTPEDKFSLNFEQKSNVALLTQSGALGIIEIENLKNAISPRAIVSYGNQLDVDPCDLVAYFGQDPMIDVIGCYIEGFRPGAGRRFFNIAGRSQKPVIVYKAGRTEAGQRATQSHTASMAGEYTVAKAAMKQAGLIVADTMIDHGDLIKTFALFSDFKVQGNRVAVIANAGYEKTSAADHLGTLQLAEFDLSTQQALKAILPQMVLPDPLLDLTPMADDAVFEGCIQAVLASDAVDALLISIVPQSALIHTTDAEIQNNPDNIAARILRLVHLYKKPTVVSVNVISRADAVYNALGKTLDAGGVPTFLTANRAMFCLNAFVRYRLLRKSGARSEWLK